MLGKKYAVTDLNIASDFSNVAAAGLSVRVILKNSLNEQETAEFFVLGCRAGRSVSGLRRGVHPKEWAEVVQHSQGCFERLLSSHLLFRLGQLMRDAFEQSSHDENELR